MSDNEEKLPQNIQHLLMEIGERMVLFRLYILAKDTEWDVYQNLGEKGCDLLIVNGTTNNKIKIEVKTRQRLYTTSKKGKNRVQFTVTENEFNSCDFIAAYWVEENYFFIVPKDELSATSSNGKLLFKFIVSKNQDGVLNEKGKEFVNRWDLITDKL